MLQSLYIKNYVLIDEIHIDFQPGLNIITGETGAGKSILIGALGALLGDKWNRDIIRAGADKAIVEGEFALKNLNGLQSFFKTREVDESIDLLLIRREVSGSGRSRCFINDQPVAVDVLTELGDLLVDLHGQHAHQLLLRVPYHGEYLDAFAGLSQDLARLKTSFQQFTANIKKLAEIEKKAQDAEQSRDFMRFQLKEITAIAPQPDEDETLKTEEHILRNAETLAEKTSQLFQKLYEAEGSVSELLSAAEADLSQLAQIDETFAPMVSECQNARIVVTELAKTVGAYRNNISFDPERLEKIRTRAANIANLKRKYGGSIDSVLTYQRKLEQELALVDNLNETIAALKEQIEVDRQSVAELSRYVSDQRRQAGQKLGEGVVAALHHLGMARVRFDVRQNHTLSSEEPIIYVDGESVRVGPRGYDQIEFMLSANPGEDHKPLADVASGGEISRVMLALKSLLAEADKVPVLIFDEIDIGISGRIAQAVGRSLRNLSRSHQVICITHLPQIASMADHHFLVEKKDDGRYTRTTIRPLKQDERIRQIAALVGGELVTEAHLRSAEELMEEAARMEEPDDH
ncbi:DNA repair protein RecN [candidate division KSB1 bacterium]|nr:DNA repair protein RecN [candidate division KSB1 bacterium]